MALKGERSHFGVLYVFEVGVSERYAAPCPVHEFAGEWEDPDFPRSNLATLHGKGEYGAVEVRFFVALPSAIGGGAFWCRSASWCGS